MKSYGNINLRDITDNGDGGFTAFREKLMAVEQFPTIFVFKFILPAAEEGKAKIESIFEHPSTKINVKQSGGGKYESFTVETFVNSADHVINYYREVGRLEKVVML
ncbi:MAG: DUF493 domain-containing protein [Leadbetterella sp.]|nr:DUF493 domain-containing protein [Leadbetterella sp.]